MIDATRPFYDPLAYALMRPTGERGWTLEMPHSKGARNVTSIQFSAYRLMLRASPPDLVQLRGRLLHQYMCDMWANVAQCRLKYFRRNQEPIREASYRLTQKPPQVPKRDLAAVNVLSPCPLSQEGRGRCGSYIRPKWKLSHVRETAPIHYLHTHPRLVRDKRIHASTAECERAAGFRTPRIPYKGRIHHGGYLRNRSLWKDIGSPLGY